MSQQFKSKARPYPCPSSILTLFLVHGLSLHRWITLLRFEAFWNTACSDMYYLKRFCSPQQFITKFEFQIVKKKYSHFLNLTHFKINLLARCIMQHYSKLDNVNQLANIKVGLVVAIVWLRWLILVEFNLDGKWWLPFGFDWFWTLKWRKTAYIIPVYFHSFDD